jgi:hypothetical protein
MPFNLGLEHAIFAGILLVVGLLVIMLLRGRKVKVPGETNFTKNDEWLKEMFTKGNMIVIGKKGKGKDVLFNHVINLIDMPHYANMPYNHNTEIRLIKDLELAGNTFEALVNGTVTQCERTLQPNTNFWISDAGIFLPSQEDIVLQKLYPTLPVHYALSRQTYQMNIHANTQELTRVWKKLREQTDGVIFVRRNKKTSKHITLEIVYWEYYKSAEAGIMPLASGTEQQYAEFEAKYGIIERRFIRVYWEDVTFDTHYLGQKLLKEQEPVQQKRSILAWLQKHEII